MLIYCAIRYYGKILVFIKVGAFLQFMASSLDVKKLNNKQLEELASDIREQIVQTVSKNGGHLSANLGMVDSTIALHKVFDFAKDKLIFDVGHQCYTHKILSGRNDDFKTIRLDDGLSGFPDINESVYDAFSVGHAGTSISAGLGYCTARDKLNEDYTVVCVVGDGSFSNGLNLEAIVSSNNKPKNFIVILNDNGMSISKNKNGFYRMLSKSTTKRGYVGSKKLIRRIFGNSFVTKGLAKFRDFIKRVINKSDYFESFGFKYVGVVDGNDIKDMVTILERVKFVAKEKAVLLHIKTKKGKGLKEAEERADAYHGVGVDFKVDNGNFALSLGEKLNSLIEKDNRIVAITAGMASGTGLSLVEEKNPKNFIDVGIAEEYAVTLASGMALGGLKPVVAIYSTFLQRAYDQILHDVCNQNLPIVFCIDRAGLVGQDGKTHQGVFDISYLSHLPNIKVLAPNTTDELGDFIEYALSLNSPVAIRYPKNSKIEQELIRLNENTLWSVVKKGDKVNILAVGPNMLNIAKECADSFDGVGVISVRSIKPMCEKTLESIKDSAIVVLEENSEIGGFGSMVSTYYANKNQNVRLKIMGVKDKFIRHGLIDTQMKDNDLSKESLEKEISKYLI
ncbi:MAG: 1-deoxy-D-xylulose-5-phosphate synthase [Clostridiales bacterium]|nr:1-deoxy-D-xylulose-5-phosphate synthase [Clostridiales bacterium]